MCEAAIGGYSDNRGSFFPEKDIFVTLQIDRTILVVKVSVI